MTDIIVIGGSFLFVSVIAFLAVSEHRRNSSFEDYRRRAKLYRQEVERYSRNKP